MILVSVVKIGYVIDGKIKIVVVLISRTFEMT